MEIEDLKSKIRTLYDTINNLKNSVDLKDEQLDTFTSTLNLKNEQIKTLETSIKLKEEKTETLEKSLSLKKEELNSAMSSSVDKSVLDIKDKQLEELQKEIEVLNQEIDRADEDFDKLELENEELRKELSGPKESAIIDFTNREVEKSAIIEKIKEIIHKSVHSVTLSIPNINDLQEFVLYEIRSSVNMKISCQINPELEKHAELLEEYESFDNISLRNFDGADRYVIIRDGEELFFAVLGKNENNYLTLYTKDPAHIKFFNSLVMESWLRSRKI